MRPCVVFLVLAALSACSGGGGGGEAEPNDSFAQATPLEARSQTISAAIDPIDDWDTYRLDVGPGEEIQLTAEAFEPGGGCPSVDTVIDLYDGAQTLLKFDDDTLNRCSCLDAVLSEGTYYLRVRRGPEQPGPFSYVLRISWTAISTVAESEPNEDGTPSSSSDYSTSNADGPFTASATILGAISPAGDEDVFALYNYRASSVRVAFHADTDPASGCNCLSACSGPGLDLWVHYGDLVYGYGGLDPCSYVEHTIPPGQTVFARVQQWSDTAIIPAYRLYIDFR